MHCIATLGVMEDSFSDIANYLSHGTYPAGANVVNIFVLGAANDLLLKLSTLTNSIRNHAVIQEYNTLAYIYNSLNNKLGTGMCPTPLSALGQL